MEVTLAIKVELEELVPKDLVFILQNADAARIVRLTKRLTLAWDCITKPCLRIVPPEQVCSGKNLRAIAMKDVADRHHFTRIENFQALAHGAQNSNKRTNSSAQRRSRKLIPRRRSIENVSILERPGKLQFPFDPACRMGLHVTVRIPGIAVANFARKRMRATGGGKRVS